MYRRKSLPLLFLMIAGLFLSLWVTGCALDPESKNSSRATLFTEETPLSPHVKIYTSSVTATIRPTSTNELTRTPTNTLTPVPPTPTLTLPVPLELEQASEEIKTLLENPQNCPTPCFWGIMPNFTTMGEARNFFHRLGAPLSSSFRDENVFYASPNYDSLSLNVQLVSGDELVKYIRARIGFENYKGPSSPRLWSAFSPENLIRFYGKPSSVELSISYPTEPGFPAGIAWYNMILRFDQYPFVIHYYRSQVKQGEFIQACPLTDQFTVVDILFGYDPKTYKSNGIFGTPLEEVTSLNIDQMVELMTQEKELACFDIDTEAYRNP